MSFNAANRSRAHRRAADQQKITESQRRAIFAAARARGLALDDLRAMTPQNSISRLTVAQAAALLERINGGPRDSQRRPRRPKNVIALVSPSQRDLIDRLRIGLGWTPPMLEEHLAARKHPGDPARKMSSIDSSSDAVAVIEHLKIVLRRTLESHAKSLDRPGDPRATMPDHPARSAEIINALMARLPAHPRLIDLYHDRLLRLHHAMCPTIDSRTSAQQQCAAIAWLAARKLPDGRRADAIASCADAAEAVRLMERELARRAQSPTPTGTEAAPHARP